jgi:D-glycero-D-manno-heptose 1,7-bisphosphate phosphatase
MGNTVFLDRDGVINVDSPNYIKNEFEFEFIPKSPEAIALLCKSGFDVILITNQSMIGRKMVNQKTLDTIFEKMNTGITKCGGQILDIFFCPHTPKENCACRKPAPGLILDAQKKHEINLLESCMIGDSAKDIECALNAGCAKTFLVKTGNGPKAEQELSHKGITPDQIFTDLYEAVCWIIENVKR